MTKDELANQSRNTLGYSERMTQDLIDAYDFGAVAEREAIIAMLLELGALGDGTYLEAIRMRSNA